MLYEQSLRAGYGMAYTEDKVHYLEKLQESLANQLRQGKERIEFEYYDGKNHEIKKETLTRQQAETKIRDLNRQIDKEKGIPWYERDSAWHIEDGGPVGRIIGFLQDIAAAIARAVVHTIDYLNPEYRAELRAGMMAAYKQTMQDMQREKAAGPYAQDKTREQSRSDPDRNFGREQPNQEKDRQAQQPKPKTNEELKQDYVNVLRGVFPTTQQKIEALLTVQHTNTCGHEQNAPLQFNIFPDDHTKMVQMTRKEADALLKEVNTALSFLKEKFPEEYVAAETAVKKEELEGQYTTPEYKSWLRENIYKEQPVKANQTREIKEPHEAEKTQETGNVQDMSSVVQTDDQRITIEEIREKLQNAVSRKTTDPEKASAVTVAVYDMIQKDPSVVMRLREAEQGTPLQNLKAYTKDGRELQYSAISAVLFRRGNLITRNPAVLSYLPPKEEKAKFYEALVSRAAKPGRYTKSLDEILQSARSQAEKGSETARVFMQGMDTYLQQTKENTKEQQPLEEQNITPGQPELQEQAVQQKTPQEQAIKPQPDLAEYTAIAASITDQPYLQQELISYMSSVAQTDDQHMSSVAQTDDHQINTDRLLTELVKEHYENDTLPEFMFHWLQDPRPEPELYAKIAARAGILDPTCAEVTTPAADILEAEAAYEGYLGDERTLADTAGSRHMYAVLGVREGALYVGTDNPEVTAAVDAALTNSQMPLETFAARDNEDIMKDAVLYGGLSLDALEDITPDLVKAAMTSDLMRGDTDRFQQDFSSWQTMTRSRNEVAIGKDLAGMLYQSAQPGDLQSVETSLETLKDTYPRMCDAVNSEYDRLDQEAQQQADYNNETYRYSDYQVPDYQEYQDSPEYPEY